MNLKIHRIVAANASQGDVALLLEWTSAGPGSGKVLLVSVPTSKLARIGVATDGTTLCGVEHKRDGVIGREVANIALIMFAEKSCASATKIL